MPTQKEHHPPLAAHVLLQPQPPQALSRIAIKDVGKVQRRNAGPISTIASNSAMSNSAMSNAASNAVSNGAGNTSSVLMGGESGDSGMLGEDRDKAIRGESYVRPDALTISFPSEGMRLSPGISKRVMLDFQGGTPPYYVLINDEVQSEQHFFSPEHNGFYQITIIDSKGESKSIQVLIQGISD